MAQSADHGNIHFSYHEQGPEGLQQVDGCVMPENIVDGRHVWRAEELARRLAQLPIGAVIYPAAVQHEADERHPTETPVDICGGLAKFDRDNNQVTVQGVTISLTSQESRFLDALVSAPDIIRPDRELLSVLRRGEELYPRTSILRVYMYRLRTKLGEDVARHLIRVTGMGYVYRPAVQKRPGTTRP